ncbi:transcription elongation factor spt5 [Ceratobasidium sp. 428]|nr:transcription elongation factor spt5 [Ceratobasidium sp. 428]
MKPAMAGGAGGMVGSGIMNRAPRDRLIGVSVMMTKGLQKGYMGTIKETNGNIVRVELVTNNKVISIEKDKLRMKGQDGKFIPLNDDFPRRNNDNRNKMGPPASFPGTGANAGNAGWGTPGSNRGGGGGGGGWGASSPANGRMSSPYVNSGSKTPGWGEGLRTPFGGGKTPAWNASSTQNPSTSDSFGSKTPGGAGSSGWGGATPARPPNPWGDATPSRPAGSWGGATPRAIATDVHGHKIRVWDNMKEIGGEMCKGQVLHIHQSTSAFLHNHDIAENGSVFVTHARSLVSVAPKEAGAAVDLSKMKPAMAGGASEIAENKAYVPGDWLIGYAL